MPEVSIIIVVKSDLGIGRTLELIYAQHTTTKYEVIVVDASEPEYLQVFGSNSHKYTGKCLTRQGNGLLFLSSEIVGFNCQRVKLYFL